MFATPPQEYLLKKRSEISSASRVSPAHTASLKLSSEVLLEEAQILEERAKHPILDTKPRWKGTSEIVNGGTWPEPRELASPDPMGRVEVRPKSATRPSRRMSSFGSAIRLTKERPKSAPRSRPLTKTPPTMINTVNRLSTPKKRSSPPPPVRNNKNIMNTESSTTSQPKEETPSRKLPSVVFRNLGKIKAQRNFRSSIVVPIVGVGGIGSDNPEANKKPSYWASGANADDTATVWNAVSSLQKELVGHAHQFDMERITECKAIKEWVSVHDEKTLIDDPDVEVDKTLHFYDTDKPEFPSFEQWRNEKQIKSYHGSSLAEDERSYDICRRLYFQSAELITFEELTAVRSAQDACSFFLEGGLCSSLTKTDFELLLGSEAAFSTNWVRKVLYRPVSKLIGGLLIDIKESRACFRVTGFSAHVPPSVALDELARSGSIPYSNALICLESDKSCHSKYQPMGRGYSENTKERNDNTNDKKDIDNDVVDVGSSKKLSKDIVLNDDENDEEKVGKQDIDTMSDLGNVSEIRTIGTRLKSRLESRAETLLSKTRFEETRINEQDSKTDGWFRGCGSWTFDPSANSDAYGLITPVAMIECSKRHVATLQALREARVNKARDIYQSAVQACHQRAEKVKIDAMLEKTLLEAASIAEEEATYNAESINRKIEQHIREPWCKTLWNALWVGKLATIQECFDGMLAGGIITERSFKLFHCEVILPPPCHGGAPVRVVRLEPAGAPESLRPTASQGDKEFSLFYGGIVRRSLVYSCSNALDAFLCMRKLEETTNRLVIAPPVAEPETLPWLIEHCGPETKPDNPITEAVSLIDDKGSVDLNDDNTFASSMLLPTLGRNVVLDVPVGIMGEKIEIPLTARLAYDSFREVDGELTRVDFDNCSYLLDNSPDNSPTPSLSTPRSRNSVQISPIQLVRKVLSEETEVEEEANTSNSKPAPILHRRASGTSLWWRMREEQQKEKAKTDSDVHYTKMKPYEYKPMNKPLV